MMRVTSGNVNKEQLDYTIIHINMEPPSMRSHQPDVQNCHVEGPV